jgi:hypothetical protein
MPEESGTLAPNAGPRSRARRRFLIIAVAVAATLLVGAGAAVVLLQSPNETKSTVATASSTTHGTPTTQAAAAPTPTPTFAHYTGDLDDLLVPQPRGTSPWNYQGLKPGMSDAARVAALWNADKPAWMLDLLNELNFERSAIRSWFNDSTNTAVIVGLLQFKEPARAYTWKTRVSSVLRDDPTHGSVAELNDATWSLATGQHDSTLAFHRDQFAVIIFFLASGRADKDDMIETATVQFHALRG